jgi:gliding motility-associated-like protein
MNKRKFRLLSALILVFSLQINAQVITIDDTFSAQQLIEDVLIDSPCANVSNFSVSGWTFDNDNRSYGYFTDGGSNFPFENGVIISTGRAVSAIGPNASLQSEGPVTWAGDNDLEAAINESSSINATVLEFDFLPLANKVSFEYIFSSEQYLSSPNPNQCNFSDGFVFLLREVNSQDQYENLAVVPGTTIPVKITTVRGSGTICPPANENFFDAFNGTNHPTNFNGQTKILEASANVTPGVLYHMKLVVADQGNQLFDSAIFLGGGSFKVEIDLGEDRLIANENPLCNDEVFVLDATQSGNSNVYKWFRNGVLLNNENNPTYEVENPGIYTVEVELENSGCVASGEIEIEYATGSPLNDTTLTQCADENGQAIFNLTTAQEAIIPAGTLFQNISFYNSLNDAETSQNVILNPLNFTSSNIDLFVRVVNNLGCFSVATLTLEASQNDIDVLNLQFCDTDDVQDGLTTINLQSNVLPAFTDGTNPDVQVFFYNTISDAYNATNNLSNDFSNTIPFEQTIYAKVLENGSCLGITEINLSIFAFSGFNLADESLILCKNESLILQIPSGFLSYQWSNDSTSSTISVDEPGLYSVVITSQAGCVFVKNYEIIGSETAIIDNIETTNFQGNNNSISVEVSGIGEYVYSLNGINYQDEPFFENLSSGVYTVYVKDIFCGEVSEQVTILGFPKFFTPNADGVNDYWVVNFLPGNFVIYIFDRFGKLLYSYKRSDIGWDGTFQNKPMPANDYWFVVKDSEGRTFKSNFSLLR